MICKRTQIREAVVSRLIKYLGRMPVYKSRPHPVVAPDAPCVLVYFGEESLVVSEGQEYSPIEYERKLPVMVDIVLTGSQDADVDLDRIGVKIEEAFFEDTKFKNEKGDPLVYGSQLTNVTPITFTSPGEEGDRVFYVQRMIWNLTYETQARQIRPSTVAPFLQFGADIIENEALTEIETTIREH